MLYKQTAILFRRTNKTTQKNNMPRQKKYSDVSQYDPKIHTKTKGGLGFGMKKNTKNDKKYESSGLQLIDVFRWEVPENLKDAYEEMKKENA
jgi:hypothetical protein